eukprot:640288-Amphidinium_carterae.1
MKACQLQSTPSESLILEQEQLDFLEFFQRRRISSERQIGRTFSCAHVFQSPWAHPRPRQT